MEFIDVEDLEGLESDEELIEEEEEYQEEYQEEEFVDNYIEEEEYHEEEVGFNYELYPESDSEEDVIAKKRVENLLTAITALNDLESEDISAARFKNEKKIILDSLGINERDELPTKFSKEREPKTSTTKSINYNNLNIQISHVADLSDSSDSVETTL